MLSVETAKAVVEVPAPFSGRVARLHAAEGDIVETGKPLIDIDTGAGAGKPAAESDQAKDLEESPAGGDSGTVVGSMPVSDEELVETAVAGSKRGRARGKVKAAPAVRALAAADRARRPGDPRGRGELPAPARCRQARAGAIAAG